MEPCWLLLLWEPTFLHLWSVFYYSQHYCLGTYRCRSHPTIFSGSLTYCINFSWTAIQNLYDFSCFLKFLIRIWFENKLNRVLDKVAFFPPSRLSQLVFRATHQCIVSIGWERLAASLYPFVHCPTYYIYPFLSVGKPAGVQSAQLSPFFFYAFYFTHYLAVITCVIEFIIPIRNFILKVSEKRILGWVIFFGRVNKIENPSGWGKKISRRFTQKRIWKS